MDCLRCRLWVVAGHPRGCNMLYWLSDVVALILCSTRGLFLSRRKGRSLDSPMLFHGVRKYVAHFHEALLGMHAVFSFVLCISHGLL